MSHIETRILHAVFRLSRANGRLDATTLGKAAHVTPTRAATALLELERDGLVDATRARLTMLGLARAVATGAAQSGTGGGGVVTRSEAPPPRPSYRPEPMAASC